MSNGISADEIAEIVLTVTEDKLAKTHWENQFISDDGDVPLCDEAADVEGKFDSMVSNFWKNQFVTDMSQPAADPVKEMKPPLPHTCRLRKIPERKFQGPDGWVEMDSGIPHGVSASTTKRNFFIDSLCEVLGISRGNVKIANTSDMKAVVNETIWTRPSRLQMDLYVDPFAVEYVAAKIGEIYGINQVRAKKMREDAKTFRDFVSAVVAYDTEMTTARLAKLDENFREEAWGFSALDEKSCEDDSEDLNVKERERLLLRETARSSSRIDSILKKRLMAATAKKTIDEPLPTRITPSSSGAIVAEETADLTKQSMKQLAAIIGDCILPAALQTHPLGKPKKVTISMTFEMA